MRSNYETIDIAVVVVHETPRAYLVADADTDGSIEHWLPKSQTQIEWSKARTKRGRIATVTIPEWLAEEKGLM